MKRISFTILAVALLSGCQSTSNQGRYTYTQPNSNQLPVLADPVFEAHKLEIIERYKQISPQNSAIKVPETFQDCGYSMQQKMQLLQLEGAKQHYKQLGVDFEIISLSVKSTKQGCSSYSPADFDYTDIYTSSITKTNGKISQSHYLKESRAIGFDLIIESVTDGETDHKVGMGYNKNFMVVYRQPNKKALFAFESVMAKDGSAINVLHEANFVRQLATSKNGQFDGYNYNSDYAPKPICYKNGEMQEDDSYCRNLSIHSDLTEVKKAAEQRPRSERIYIPPAPSKQKKSDNSEMWGLAAGLVATVAGVNQGMSSDSAANVGAGVYDYVANDNTDTLNSATKNIKSQASVDRTTRQNANQKSTNNSPSGSATNNSATAKTLAGKPDYADEIVITKMSAMIPYLKQAGQPTASYESILREELSKPRNPSAARINIKPDLIKSYRFCQQNNLEDQIATHCKSASLYYVAYLSALGTGDTEQAYSNHQDASKLALKLHQATAL